MPTPSHTVEIWLDGIEGPFTLRWHDELAAARTADRLMHLRGSSVEITDDLGQTLFFEVAAVKALRQTGPQATFPAAEPIPVSPIPVADIWLR